jgi:hypothetical protein
MPPGRVTAASKIVRYQLGLVAQTLLMAVLLHALAALVLVDLGFTSLFQ